MDKMEQLRDFVEDLNRIVNKPRFPFWPWFSEAIDEMDILCETHRSIISENDGFGEPHSIPIKAYTGENTQVLNLIEDLQKGRLHFVDRIVLQGSLATKDEISYSDFDALVILKDEALESSENLANAISSLWKAYRNLIDQDVLQHHGWFVTTETLLYCHFDDFFPASIFTHGAMISTSGSDHDIRLNLVKYKPGYRRALDLTCAAIIEEIESGKCMENTYHLKSCLSKFMLLPSLYCQVKSESGVFKKDSFELARVDFSSSDWVIMEEVSLVRERWINPNSWLLKRLALFLPSMSRKFVKRFAPAISDSLRLEFADKRDEMVNFVRLIQSMGRRACRAK